MKRIIGLTAALIWASGCATVAPSTEAQAHRAKIAIFQAERADAKLNPYAAEHLEFARSQLSWARRYLSDGEPQLALMLYERAEADADLALAIAKNRTQRSMTTALMRELYRRRALRQKEMTP